MLPDVDGRSMDRWIGGLLNQSIGQPDVYETERERR